MELPPAPARLISCDEAGFTGPNLLDEDQPVFAYTAIDLTPAEAQSIIDSARARHRVQAPELKAKLLRRRPNWGEIALEIASQVEGRAMVMVCDKRLNLGGKTYEYIFEPVLEDNNVLFYRHNLHRFVMNAMYRTMYATGAQPHAMALELECFMRSFEPQDAPLLFAGRTSGDDNAVVLNCVLRFARGYSARIFERTAHLRVAETLTGKWTLDLTSTALFSLLFRGWGLRYPSVDLLCDDSQPLRAAAPFFDGWVGRDDAPEITDGRRFAPIRGNLANPIRFGSSLDHPTIQIADVISGASADFVRAPDSDRLAGWGPFLDRHIHEDHILPNDNLIDTRRLEARVNMAVLRELARRADLGADPLAGMETFYADMIRRFRSPASRMKPPKPTRRRPPLHKDDR
ncbi:DUF3800 domain-containing protein (plasmid) [Bradyrhizobium septentrionale]|uniref:DUF3800 domain-containing protein n=1 Tax=Bradyrhizobium septentrionale TaxID=1404411 RepID=UPI0030CE2756